RHHAKGKETGVDAEEPLPRDEQTRVVAQPSEAPFPLEAQPILLRARDNGTSSLRSPLRRAALGRDAHADATAAQYSTERATSIRTVCHKFHRSPLGPPTGTGDTNCV